MGGGDRGDQLRGYYKCRVKSRKFYKYIFYLLDVAVTNAFVLHQGWSPRPRPHSAVKTIKTFRLPLAHELIGEYCSRRHGGRVGSSVIPLPLRHYPVKIPPTNPNQRKRGRCAHCDSVCHKRTDTQWFCRECDVWLCHTGYEESDFFFMAQETCGQRTIVYYTLLCVQYMVTIGACLQLVNLVRYSHCMLGDRTTIS